MEAGATFWAAGFCVLGLLAAGGAALLARRRKRLLAWATLSTFLVAAAIILLAEGRKAFGLSGATLAMLAPLASGVIVWFDWLSPVSLRMGPLRRRAGR